jgi:hypothetical protein
MCNSANLAKNRKDQFENFILEVLFTAFFVLLIVLTFRILFRS